MKAHERMRHAIAKVVGASDGLHAAKTLHVFTVKSACFDDQSNTLYVNPEWVERATEGELIDLVNWTAKHLAAKNWFKDAKGIVNGKKTG